MDIEYTSCDELLILIKRVNEKYYEMFNANILFIEELYNKIFVVYIIELRDAYSHIIRIFDFDILSEQGRKNVQNHLGKYISHLQRGLLDTFRKILALELKLLINAAPRKDKRAIEYQVAKKAHELRIMGKDISVDKRIEGYLSLLDYISEIRGKFFQEL